VGDEVNRFAYHKGSFAHRVADPLTARENYYTFDVAGAVERHSPAREGNILHCPAAGRIVNLIAAAFASVAVAVSTIPVDVLLLLPFSQLLLSFSRPQLWHSKHD